MYIVLLKLGFRNCIEQQKFNNGRTGEEKNNIILDRLDMKKIRETQVRLRVICRSIWNRMC